MADFRFQDSPELMRRAGRLLVGLLALGGLLDARAGATPSIAGNPVVLPPWVIAERTDPLLQSARADWFAGALGPTSVVGRADWAGRGVATLAEALRRAPGVMLLESFGGFEPPRLSVRGSGLDSAPTSRGVALLVDGLPLARADGSFHSGLFDPLLFSGIEVYRGTMHMALTPAALGGVLHAVPERTPGTAVRLDAGGDGTRRAQVTHAASRLRAAGSWAQSDGWRDHSEQQRGAVETALRHDLGPTTRLEFTGYAAAADYDVPGPLTLAAATAQPRSVSAAVLRDLPRRSSYVVRPGVQVSSQGRAGGVAAGFAVQRLYDEFFQLQANGVTESTSDDATAHVTLSRRLTSGSRVHHLLARATYSGGESQVARFLNERGERGSQFASYASRADTAALSLEDMVWIRPDLAVGAGATVLRAERTLLDHAANTAVARALTFDDVSPRAGVTWSAGDRLSVSAAVSRGVELPVFDDMLAVSGVAPNLTLRSRDLAEQRATTFEIGGRGRLGPLGWNVTGYRGEWNGEILRLADASGLPRGAVNAGVTIHEGIESSLQWAVSAAPHRWSVGVTSVIGRFRFDGDPVYGDNRLAGAPPHVGSAELTYGHARGFFGALETTWSAGRTWADHAGRLGYGGHGLMHARVGWRRPGRWSVFLACRNVFDRGHIASTAGVLDVARVPAATSIFLPGTGRGFSLGLEWKP
jgi:iron complex outermembrane receptor protein